MKSFTNEDRGNRIYSKHQAERRKLEPAFRLVVHLDVLRDIQDLKQQVV